MGYASDRKEKNTYQRKRYGKDKRVTKELFYSLKATVRFFQLLVCANIHTLSVVYNRQFDVFKELFCSNSVKWTCKS